MDREKIDHEKLREYKAFVHEHLEKIIPIFAHAIVGDYSRHVDVLETDDEFAEVYAGVDLLIGVVQQKIKELEESNKKLADEKTLDEALLASIGDGMIATNSSGEIISMSKSASELLGVLETDALGKLPEDVFSMEDERGKGAGGLKLPIHITLETGKKFMAQTYNFIRKDGRKFPTSLVITPVHVAGVIFGAIMIFRDITKEREIDRAKSEFVSLASHQLRTPLSIVRWYVNELFTLHKDNDPELKKFIEVIYDANLRMINLVDAFLNVSRIDLGTFIVEPQSVDLERITQDVIKDLTIQIREREISITQDYDHNLLLETDPKLAHIVLTNLISNAIKYSNTGGNVLVTLRSDTRGITITVTDEGCGIPHSQQGKIFTKLFRASNAMVKDPDGTGLGLYMVYSILEHIGGRIWFESEENKGSAFHVFLPDKPIEKETTPHSLNSMEFVRE